MRGYCSYRHKEKIRTKSTMVAGVDSERVFVVNEYCSNVRSRHRREKKEKKKKEEEFNN